MEKEKILKLIEDAHTSMEKSKEMFGKEIYQKRFKPVYEGYLTALCTILELDEDQTTDISQSPLPEGRGLNREV